MTEATTEIQPVSDSEAIPQATLLRLRRIGKKLSEQRTQADLLWQHELNEAAEEIGVAGIVLDLDAGTYKKQ